jgi:hypothetical protein
MKTQLRRRYPSVRFCAVGSDPVERYYSLKELGAHFPDKVTFPRIFFPQDADGLYRSMFLHAVRLEEWDMLHIEQLIAAGMIVSEQLQPVERHGKLKGGKAKEREIIGMAQSIIEAIDPARVRHRMSEWERQRFFEWQTKKANAASQQVRKAKAATKAERAKELRATGMTMQQIADEMGTTKMSVSRWLRQ